LNNIAAQLLTSPIRKKDRVVHFIILVGLYQLRHINTAQHAAVAETVSACKQLNKVWAKNLVNGCLRTYLRKVESNEIHIFSETDSDTNQLAHPDWIKSTIQEAWPQQAVAIFAANNQRPPMCLRVNSMQNSRSDYLTQLESSHIQATEDSQSSNGIILETAVSVLELPGFFDGTVSVQDTAAQIACDILDAQPEHEVLDACAAPGGKTAHILERASNNLNMTALDISEKRCEQLNDTLKRLKLNAAVAAADATITPTWQTPKHGYDRILIDAPCSGFGVIRRHPDIKHHRRTDDINALNEIQLRLLLNLWPLLKPGGQLLYMTCSILPSENDKLVSKFVASQNDVMLKAINHPNALTLNFGVQTLPGIHGMDGFYYSLLSKKT